MHRRVIALQAEQARLAVVFAEHLNRWQAERVWTSDGPRSAAHQLADDELSPDQHHDRLADSNLQLSPTLDDTCALTGTLGPIDGHIAHNELH